MAIDGLDIKRGCQKPQSHERQVGFERRSVDDESGGGAKQQRRKQRMRAEAASQRECAKGRDERKQNVNRMERDLRDAPVKRNQQREEPGIERRMRLPAHVDVAPHENIGGVFGMKRLNLRVGGLGEIKHVVALESLIQERQTQSKDHQRDKDNLTAQESR